MKECQQFVTVMLGDHSGQATHRVVGFWTGQNREELGPDLLLCETHATVFKNMHPLCDWQIEPIKED